MASAIVLLGVRRDCPDPWVFRINSLDPSLLFSFPAVLLSSCSPVPSPRLLPSWFLGMRASSSSPGVNLRYDSCPPPELLPTPSQSSILHIIYVKVTYRTNCSIIYADTIAKPLESQNLPPDILTITRYFIIVQKYNGKTGFIRFSVRFFSTWVFLHFEGSWRGRDMTTCDHAWFFAWTIIVPMGRRACNRGFHLDNDGVIRLTQLGWL